VDGPDDEFEVEFGGERMRVRREEIEEVLPSGRQGWYIAGLAKSNLSLLYETPLFGQAELSIIGLPSYRPERTKMRNQ
jgi:hypothetical protein